MKRREFIGKTSCGMAGFMAAGMGFDSEQQPPPPTPPERKKYDIEIEIYEVGEKTRCVKKGTKYNYPGDIGKMCPWLREAMYCAVRMLAAGVTFPWRYTGTPYEKKLNEDGITTEFVRCPDPTQAGVVAKITRTEIA